jgi:hypothetical protein
MPKGGPIWLSLCLLSVSGDALGMDGVTYDHLWTTVVQQRQCVPVEQSDFILATCEGGLELWYFTRPNNPAHPGVVQRKAVKQGSVWQMQEEGWSFGSDAARPAFEAWLAQIVDLDRQMKEELEKRHSPQQ